MLAVLAQELFSWQARDAAVEVIEIVTHGQEFGFPARLAATRLLVERGERQLAIDTLATIVADPLTTTAARLSAARQFLKWGDRERAIDIAASIVQDDTLDLDNREVARRELAAMETSPR